MVTTIMNKGTTRKFLVTATEAAGPWSEPVWIDQPGIDPSIFFDDDGSVYLTSNGGAQGQKGFNQALFDVNTGRFLTEDRVISTGTGGAYPEGPRLFKRDGWYYLSIAEGGCQYGHMQNIARSRSPWGPFETCPRNPILTHPNRGGYPIQGIGHVDFVEDDRGQWWAFFLGYRMTRQYFYHLCREAFLAPIEWNADGWPVIGNAGTVDLEMQAHLPAPHPWSMQSVRDDSDAQNLRLPWNFLRNP